MYPIFNLVQYYIYIFEHYPLLNSPVFIWTHTTCGIANKKKNQFLLSYLIPEIHSIFIEAEYS